MWQPYYSLSACSNLQPESTILQPVIVSERQLPRIRSEGGREGKIKGKNSSWGTKRVQQCLPPRPSPLPGLWLPGRMENATLPRKLPSSSCSSHLPCGTGLILQSPPSPPGSCRALPLKRQRIKMQEASESARKSRRFSSWSTNHRQAAEVSLHPCFRAIFLLRPSVCLSAFRLLLRRKSPAVFGESDLGWRICQIPLVHRHSWLTLRFHQWEMIRFSFLNISLRVNIIKPGPSCLKAVPWR